MERVDWKPVGDKILLKKLEEDSSVTTSGLLLVGDNSKSPYTKGEVVAVGEGTYSGGIRVPISVEVGSTILYHKEYGTDIGGYRTGHHNEYLILHQEDIVAILSD